MRRSSPYMRWLIRAAAVAGAAWWLLARCLPGLDSLLGYIVAINCVTFVFYFLDKTAARRSTERTPELTLHALSLLGGSPAAWFAQQVFRHKRRKVKFQKVFWSLVIVQLVLAFFGLHVLLGRDVVPLYGLSAETARYLIPVGLVVLNLVTLVLSLRADDPPGWLMLLLMLLGGALGGMIGNAGASRRAQSHAAAMIFPLHLLGSVYLGLLALSTWIPQHAVK